MARKMALLLVFALIFSLTACAPVAQEPTAPPTVEPTVTPEPSATPEPAPAGKPEVNFAVLSGSTGVGAAKLMADNDAGETKNSYNVTVETDNSAVTAKLMNGELDMAALATNVAANLYQKSKGQVKIVAVGNLGVLYILAREGAAELTSLADLSGKTVYAFGQGANPEYVLNYLLKENGVEPDQVDIQWQEAADLVTAKLLQGEGDYAMLPVPAATALEAKSEGKIKAVISLSEEWDKLENGSQLAMSCVVARSDFAQANPEAVADFLADYEASINYVRDNPKEAGELVAQFGITPSAGIATKAIPQCNLKFISGQEMQDTLAGYYQVLFDADPKSVGGAVPDDGFYLK